MLRGLRNREANSRSYPLSILRNAAIIMRYSHTIGLSASCFFPIDNHISMP